MLSDGRHLPADVVVGTGVRPAGGWLADSDLALDEGVLTDAGYVTALPNVVAVGGVARPWNPRPGRHVHREHRTDGAEGPRSRCGTCWPGHTVQQVDKASPATLRKTARGSERIMSPSRAERPNRSGGPPSGHKV